MIKQYKEKQVKWQNQCSLFTLSIWEWNYNFITYKWQGCEKPFPLKAFYSSCNLFQIFPFSPIPFTNAPSPKKILSGTHCSNYPRLFELPSASVSWGLQLLPLPYPSLPSILLLINQPKNSKSQLKDLRSGWKEPSGRVNAFFYPFCFIWI